ncbi:uncharacterized protein LOC120636759 [Pararge aegeria]|nr:uncharacterized protein LOC120636747 [Pararge aegeria]XP_039764254.1 uncharacterized protein LOC120636759 [Pararge aegeria]
MEQTSHSSSRPKRKHDSMINENLETFQNEIKLILQQWKEDQDSKLLQIQNDMDTIKGQISDIKKTNTDIEKTLEFMTGQYDNLNLKVNSLEKECKDYSAKITILENKIEDMTRQNFQTKIEIKNVPMEYPESQPKLLEKVLNISSILNIDISSQIRNVQRLSVKAQTNNPIVVEFTSPISANKFLNAVKKFNSQLIKDKKLSTNHLGISGPHKPIYITELLTPKTKRLFYLTRELNKNKFFKYCWTVNGKIYLRKEEGSQLIQVRSEEQLQEIRNKNSL